MKEDEKDYSKQQIASDFKMFPFILLTNKRRMLSVALCEAGECGAVWDEASYLFLDRLNRKLNSPDCISNACEIAV